jgi:hypothetical protein
MRVDISPRSEDKSRGIYVWCEDCRQQHLITWEELASYRLIAGQIADCMV